MTGVLLNSHFDKIRTLSLIYDTSTAHKILKPKISYPDRIKYDPSFNPYVKYEWAGDPMKQIIDHSATVESVQNMTRQVNGIIFYLLYYNMTVHFKRKYGVQVYLIRLFMNYRENRRK